MWRTNSRAGVQEEYNFLLLRFHSWLTNEREAHILVNNSARSPRTSDNGANAAALQASHQFIETMPNKDEADVPKITTNELSGSARLMENSEPIRALVLIYRSVRDLFSSLSLSLSLFHIFRATRAQSARVFRQCPWTGMPAGRNVALIKKKGVFWLSTMALL